MKLGEMISLATYSSSLNPPKKTDSNKKLKGKIKSKRKLDCKTVKCTH